ncbi:hypothetical protein GF312_22525 [Candidatus Poribacteria bacterium]|nr:hypothetical protein [Candidatus Poribacteria bacterium]
MKVNEIKCIINTNYAMTQGRIIVSKSILPTSVDLTPRFEKMKLPTRPQGKRGTCSVFTFVGALEYAVAVNKSKGTLLSVEFANWASHKAADRKQDGAFFSELWDGYQEYGICEEKDLPYQDEFDVDLQPSDEIIKKAEKVKSTPVKYHWIKEWDVETGLTEEHFQGIKETLANNYPVLGGFRWPKEAKWEDGVLQMSPPSKVFDGHCIVIS